MRSRGFTLLELLVAVVITLVLAAVVLSVTTSVLDQLRRTHGAAGAVVEAKLVLDQLERDLQSAIERADGRSWFDVRLLTAGELDSHGWRLPAGVPMKPVQESLLMVPAVTALVPDPSIGQARFGRSGVWLRLLTSDYDGSVGGSLPVAVAYQVVRREVSSSIGAPIRYALFREKLTAANTFNTAMTALFTDLAPVELTQPDSSDVLAGNVVDFGIWLHARDAQGRLVRLFPTDAGTPLSRAFPPGGEPAVADVMLRILTEEGASMVQAMEEGHGQAPPGQAPGEWWWSVVEAHSRVFVRRIELKAVLP